MAMRIFSCTVLLFTFITGFHSALAQQAPVRFVSSGMLAGYGPEFSDNTNYKVFFIMWDYSRSFKRAPVKKDFVAWYAQPQFNFVRNRTTPGQGLDFESGLNLGIRNYIKIKDRFYFYQMLGSGPHYISAKLERQAGGFIFSDNLVLGAMLPVDQKILLNLQFGIRHISNANIQLPNRGVNTFLFLAGISKLK